jgi:hypothetical protein
LLVFYSATKNEKDFARYLQIPEYPEFIKSKFIGKELVDIAVNFGGKIAELVREDSDHGWMLMIRENNFEQAGERLVEQAKDDSNAYGRRTLISLAKLASIAGGAPPPDNTQGMDKICFLALKKFPDLLKILMIRETVFIRHCSNQGREAARLPGYDPGRPATRFQHVFCSRRV